MPATKAQEPANPAPAGGWSYAEVESALAQVLGADVASQVGWLRGRIQHLRRLGLTPPAEGGPVIYTFEWAARWLLALRLELLGLNPKDVVGFFEENWSRPPGRKSPDKPLREIVEEAHKPIANWRKGRSRTDDVWLTVTRVNFHDFPRIGLIQPYLKLHPKSNKAKAFFDYSREHSRDVVAIPLTELLRELEVALNEGG